MRITGFPTIYWSVPMIFWCIPTIFFIVSHRFLVRSHNLLVFFDWLSIQLHQKILGNGQKIGGTHQKQYENPPKIDGNQPINRGKPCMNY